MLKTLSDRVGGTIVLFTLVFFVPTLALAAGQYTPLVDLPNVGQGETDIGAYVDAIYILAISIASFLAVVKIIFGGVKYMLSDVVTDKASAKKDIRGALLGLLIVLAAVLILDTINPQLINLDALQKAPTITHNGSGLSLGNLFAGGGTGVSDFFQVRDCTNGYSSSQNVRGWSDAEIAQYAAQCVADPCYTFSRTIVNRDPYVSCTTDSVTMGQFDPNNPDNFVGNAIQITNQTQADAFKAYCHSNNQTYKETTQVVNGVDVKVGICNQTCNSGEQLDVNSNTCVPYTQIDKPVDCYLVANQNLDVCKNQQLQNNQKRLLINGTTWMDFTISGQNVQVDCGIGESLLYQSDCRNLCKNYNGTISNQICTLQIDEYTKIQNQYSLQFAQPTN